MQSQLNDVDQKLDRLTKQSKTSSPQTSESSANETGSIDDKIKNQMSKDLRKGDNIYLVYHFFRPGDSFTYEYIKEDDNMWVDGQGGAFPEMLKEAPVPTRLSIKGTLMGSSMTSGGGANYKATYGFSIPLFKDVFKRLNANSARITEAASTGEALINKKVKEALTEERVAAGKAKKKEIERLEKDYEKDKNNTVRKLARELEDKAKKLEMAESKYQREVKNKEQADSKYQREYERKLESKKNTLEKEYEIKFKTEKNNLKKQNKEKLKSQKVIKCNCQICG